MPSIYIEGNSDLVKINMLRMESYRLTTFETYNSQRFSIIPEIAAQLARNGYFYPGKGHHVQCIFCLQVVAVCCAQFCISSFAHNFHNYFCTFRNGYPAGNIPIVPRPGVASPYAWMPQPLVQALEFEPPEMSLLLVGMPAA